jgi:hypothetical protein
MTEGALVPLNSSTARPPNPRAPVADRIHDARESH